MTKGTISLRAEQVKRTPDEDVARRLQAWFMDCYAQRERLACSFGESGTKSDTYIKTPSDYLAEVITNLSDDDVVTDDVEDLIVALKRAHVINAETMVALLGNYLNEKQNVRSI